MGSPEVLDRSSTQAPRESVFPQREWMPDTKALKRYLEVPRWLDRIAKWKLKKFKEENSNPDGTAKYHNALVFMRANPPHFGHIFNIEAALSVIDQDGQVVIGLGIGIGKADVNKRDERNPLTALQREMIIREQLAKRGISKDKFRFLYVNDYGDPPKWKRTIINQLQEEGSPIDVVVGNNEWVNTTFQKPTTESDTISLAALRPPSFFRRRFRGGRVRDGLHASGALRPFGK